MPLPATQEIEYLNSNNDYVGLDRKTGAGFAEFQGPRPTQEDRIVAGSCEGESLSRRAWKRTLYQVVAGLESGVEEISIGEKQGSCLLINIIVGHQIYTANLGDSTAFVVILKNDKTNIVTPLNTLHKPTNPIEHTYITMNLGFVADKRLNGILAVSRAIGDTCFGSRINHTPDINEYTLPDLNEGEKAYLITACDGLTEGMLTTEKIGKIIRKHADHPNQTTAHLAQTLALAGYKKGSTDNISVIVTPITPNDRKPKLAAVFDGHGGCRVSEYLKRNLKQTLDTVIHSPSIMNSASFTTKEILAKINNQALWEQKTHFSFKKAPDGILQMRKALSELRATATDEDKLRCITEIAKSRLSLKGPMHLFFGQGPANITRDKSTTEFYQNILAIKTS